MIELPDNSFLIEHNIKPGTQNTALTNEMKSTAKKILQLNDGEFGSKRIVKTVGGCAMNTSRAAHNYLQAAGSSPKGKVLTLGCIGDDDSGSYIKKQLKDEEVLYDVHVEEGSLTGSCPVTVVNVDRTCIAILDACEKYPTSHLTSTLENYDMTKALFFYSTGFFIESNKEALMKMIKYA